MTTRRTTVTERWELQFMSLRVFTISRFLFFLVGLSLILSLPNWLPLFYISRYRSLLSDSPAIVFSSMSLFHLVELFLSMPLVPHSFGDDLLKILFPSRCFLSFFILTTWSDILSPAYCTLPRTWSILHSFQQKSVAVVSPILLDTSTLVNPVIKILPFIVSRLIRSLAFFTEMTMLCGQIEVWDI
ncbi:uncharacterized protein BX664DRAFT_313879 [Halteromyces radiatus]|uniref:uncharacterized protein n=1 Tax=Halteromyces radiatus TaxID=101107 RepID=UPI00221FD7C1|nr:uncharacterized protein BX664DRAFT_313879 [Halteromyces radiatus]KAI8093877.1 hypothetical protein BX664DRAFT_313879 [Halteromyces radiatus]